MLNRQNGCRFEPRVWPDDVPVPELFLCPITKRVMRDPVIDREGNSYERNAM